MSNTVAKVYRSQDKVIPIPFDFTPSQIEPDNNPDIIVAFFDCLDVNKTDGGMAFDKGYSEKTNKVYDYYGVENCKEYIAFMPYREKKQQIFCVSSSFLLEKIKDEDFPSSDLSPVWTIERYGITEEEAYLALSMDEEISKKINDKKTEFSKSLNTLRIDISKEDIERIQACKDMIEKLTEEEELLSKKCLNRSAEYIAQFLTDNYPVKAEVNQLVEPIVFYSVDGCISDDEAVVIGNAVELLFNSIEPGNVEEYFTNFTYELCSWPAIINKTFDNNGNRLFVG